MDREEIIRRIRNLDPDRLEQVRLFLDQLQGLPENQIGAKAPDPEEPEPGK